MESTAEGHKDDKDKRRWELMPFDALDVVADVLTIGANKYAPRNWELGISKDRLMGACMRHLSAYNQGNETDTETGKSHLAHAVCCLLFIMALELRGYYEAEDIRATWTEHGKR